MFEVSALNEIVDEWIEKMNISGDDMSCFLITDKIQINKKKTLWEYHDELNNRMFPTAFDL